MIEKELKKRVPTLKGNVLGIGLTYDHILDLINANNQIENCDILDLYRHKKATMGKGKQTKKKTVSIKKIKKIFHKKTIDAIICNYNEIAPYLKTLLRDTIYIGKETIYFYGTADHYAISDIIKKYKRYQVTIEEIKENEEFFFVINIKNAKNNRFMDMAYWWSDTVTMIADLIADLLMG